MNEVEVLHNNIREASMKNKQLEHKIEIISRNNEMQLKMPSNQVQVDEIKSLQNQINVEKEKYRKFSSVKKLTD